MRSAARGGCGTADGDEGTCARARIAATSSSAVGCGCGDR